MPSPRERARQGASAGPEPSPVLFIDRSRGTEIPPPALRAAGAQVITMRAYYDSEKSAAGKADVDWIADVGREGWIAPVKDSIIRTNQDEREAVTRAGLRMLCLSNANLTGKQFTERFVHHLPVIMRRARRPGPHIDGVYPDGVRRLFPRPS